MTPETGPDVDHLRERLLERRTVYEGTLLTVLEDAVALPDGGSARRELVHHRGAVAVVAIAPDGRVVLVRQWRHAVDGALWEIPAGTRDQNEPPAATATRELVEETGYTAGRWTSLGDACVSPGYSREVISFFLAEELTAGEASTDADEKLDVMLAADGDLRDLVHRGSIDCKTLGGLALAGRLPRLVPGAMG